MYHPLDTFYFSQNKFLLFLHKTLVFSGSCVFLIILFGSEAVLESPAGQTIILATEIYLVISLLLEGMVLVYKRNCFSYHVELLKHIVILILGALCISLNLAGVNTLPADLLEGLWILTSVARSVNILLRQQAARRISNHELIQIESARL